MCLFCGKILQSDNTYVTYTYVNKNGETDNKANILKLNAALGSFVFNCTSVSFEEDNQNFELICEFLLNKSKKTQPNIFEIYAIRC